MSLLYINEKEETTTINEDCYRDLAIEELILEITSIESDQKILREVFCKIPKNYETIHYRQEVLTDFIEHPEMSDELQEVLSKVRILRDFSRSYIIGGIQKASVWELLDFVQELEVYINVVESVDTILTNAKPRSVALCEVSKRIRRIINSGGIDHIRGDIKELRADISTTKSVCLGINLSPDLFPEDVKILNFSHIRYPIDSREYSGQMMHGTTYYARDNIMKCMTHEIEKHMSKCVKRMKKVFKEYLDLDGYFMVDIYDELRYFIVMSRFYRKIMEKGFTVSMPNIRQESDEIRICNVYNLRLALHQEEAIVKNDFSFTRKERIFVLTGPNRGGKSILSKGIGLTALMASLGLMVSADSYDGFRIQNIFTHYPVDDNKSIDYGRLGEEAIRIKRIVQEADTESLLLFNETYSTTCASDGLFLSQNLIHVLKEKNVPTIFNTHILELAKTVKEMNSWSGDSNVVSIVMEIKDNRNTFRVLRGEPNETSYAKNIALKYGITYEQMTEKNEETVE